MKTKTLRAFALAFFMLVLLNSCSNRMLDFTIVSSKNVTMNVKSDAPRTSATAGSIKSAVDKAIEKAGPGYDALIDGVIYEKWTYCILFNIIRYKVEGTPIKTKEIKPVSAN